MRLLASFKNPVKEEESLGEDLQPCLKCGYPVGVLAGGRDAVCKRCGYKDPCCE